MLPLRLLIVEDDLAIATMYEFKLRQSGYDVKCASNGVEGLKLAEEFQPALILLDLRMPLMNGDEMLAQVRSHDWGSEIRVVVLTNISKDEAPSSLRFLRVDRYIVKAHFTPSQIASTVNSILHVNN